MPRTKVVKKRRVTQDAADVNETTVNISQEKKKDLNQKIAELEELINVGMNSLQVKDDTIIYNMKNWYAKLRITLSAAGLMDKTLKELTQPAPPRSIRKRSNSCSVRSTAKKTNSVRSASCERTKRNVPESANKLRTPMNRNIPLVPAVTPKVNPNQPLSVLRRPRQGEFALSMDGSPLMVSSVTYDDMVTVTIPLADGRVLSILPTEGIDAADLSLDEITRNQLLKLRSNLTKCLQK